ncbi:N-acetylglucosamine-6-phosphate deacetylase [Enterococcus caccae]|uniref:N-acetylglucosamine-6-phosphate deacetylase n=1 Tax=Enterococcus caccae ATCC BAA-1240 TaxID=1158612 RepID=R3W765_9ENTE|nr:N-acetylglucosamine-6-phosphate deacetylase [Enterococcus caccae]EOL43606.1 N-acetylglucosamine-6-phosphate deacetylase [Enterococcus caccae ATCC BAA-1240]EOT67994.1 N-acetylglucosamine-6-phosphate deacetylase [Enterococcus caccae ATCC BAA-1240]OJG28517.1 N-acetylglucosamine-6-phosphate deacetylase [Enterococcus caccae]
MEKYAIKAEKFFLRGGMMLTGYLIIEDGRFGEYSSEEPRGLTILDYSQQWIAPGLVDTHIHGFLGYDVMDNDPEGLNEISKGLLQCGVTSFLPTTLTSDVETLNQVTKMIAEHADQVGGAKIQGIFFEGPFFTEKHKGAQNPKYFSDPSLADFNHWQELANGQIKKIAIAPERVGAVEFTQAVTKQGVTVALAHSAATYQQAQAAVYAGASVFVHTYNGMSGLSHREPGMVGCALTTKETTAELICDGHHVHPVAANVLITVKGAAQVALITDCMRAGGMPEGNYQLGEFPVKVANGAARLAENGSLAGSVLQLLDGVKNVVAWELASVAEAFQMASLTPAESVNIADRCGSIEAGKPADFLVVTKELELLETFVDGQSMYRK